MSIGQAEISLQAAARLLERCDELGLIYWQFDAEPNVIRTTDREHPLANWARRPETTQRVRNAVAASGHEEAQLITLDDGVTIVTVAGIKGRRKEWTIAVLHLAEQSEATFATTDPELADDAKAYAAGLASDPKSLFDIMRWMKADLVSSSRDSVAISEFSHQLGEMFEEIGLLYRIGSSMNRVANPDQFVENTCHELEQVLPFTWIAARFVQSDRVTPRLSGRLIYAGELPVERSRLGELSGKLIDDIPPENWTLVSPTEHPIADAVNAQVLAHPFHREGEVVGALLAGNKVGRDAEVSSFETQLLDAAAGYLSVFVENAGLYSDQRTLFLGTVGAMTASIDAKDRYTCGHSERVAYLGKSLALATGLSELEAERVHIGGLLHDVGKIGVPEHVLTKPGRLTDEEFDLIKLHPSIGYRILKDIPFLEDVLPGVLYHHERWDGKGYPERIGGEEIPLIARILGVADAFDAMSSTRSYRAALERDRVLEEIVANAGAQFDPTLARIFVGLDFNEYDRMVGRHQSREKNAA